MQKNIFAIGIITLFVLSMVSPIVLGYNFKIINKEKIVEEYNFNSYHISEIFNKEQHTYMEYPVYDNNKSNILKNLEDITRPLEAPMDSPWPMYCHDVRHTGRSPYSTVDTQDEIWRFKQHMEDYVRGSPVIGDDGTIYFGGSCDFYALYPNGTLKWKYDDLDFYVWSAPAIDEDDVIYFGDLHGYFYAINSDGTKKWKRSSEGDILSSPAIGDDGTIYYGNEVGYPIGGYINALYPNNGSYKWRYKTSQVVYSSPAIGDDGTIYCGSHDTYLYALYPNNGTLKWRYKTGHWIRTSPCIGDDGTIYVVSLDNHLHAVNPNGTFMWKTFMGNAGTSPTIGQDGTIYCGYTQLYAINPTNGSVKWTFDVSGKIKGSTPAHSLEDTIYFGTSNWLYAVNPEGTLKWREKIANDFIESAPAIGSNGTIYIGSAWTGGGKNYGYIHAFGELDPNAPSAPILSGQTNGNADTEYEYTFVSTSPLDRDVYYYIEWGDGSIKDWFGPFESGEETKVSHKWTSQGTYTIKSRAKDTENLWGSWGELEVNMPRNKMVVGSFFLRFLEQFPLIERFLSLLIE